MTLRYGLALWLPLLVAAPLLAQTPARPASGADAADSEPEIIVRGQRQRGAVVGDIAPEVTLSPAEIRSFGVSSISDLIAELAPQTGSGRGRGGAPLVLLEGRRIASFDEIRDLPAEAIARAEVLPEEVALKYGFPADQKVVNIVLRPRFRATTAELNDAMPTSGGINTPAAELGWLKIKDGSRLNVALAWQRNSALTYDERDVLSPATRLPFATLPNVTGIGGGEIDPALSLLAGQTVTRAAAPAAAAAGAVPLTAFVPGAGQANAADSAAFRTLVPEAQQASANIVWHKPLGPHFAATVNARLQWNEAQALLGLGGNALVLPAGNPFSPFSGPVQVNRTIAQLGALTQDISTTNAHGGVTIDGDIGAWRLSVTGNLDRVETSTTTARGLDATALQAALNANDPAVNPFGPIPAALLTPRADDRARGTSTSGGGDVLVMGPLAHLPAGDLTTSVRVGASASRFDSWALRSGIESTSGLDRQIASGQASFDLPIASRRNDVLGFLGDLSLNLNAALSHYSDAGTLDTFGYGATWKPIDGISLIASVTDDRTAPTVQQLGNPLVLTPQVLVYDAVTGQTVSVTQIGGGNPALSADRRHVLKLGLTLKPLRAADLSLTANYISSRTRDLISAFPTGSVTSAFEAAFPDRYLRGSDGSLISIDTRPVSFAEEDKDSLRWGVNFSKPLKSNLPQRFAAAFAGRLPAGPGGPGPAGLGAPGGGGPGGPGGGRGGFGGGSRLQLAIYYNWTFRDSVLVQPGVPRIDRLNGGATGNSGGTPRHTVEVQAGIFKDGLGARLSGNWRSATQVDGVPGQPASALHISSLATLDLRLFATPAVRPEWLRDHPWVRGMRISLAVTNLLNTRQTVTDGTGITPLAYQPGLIDPYGRTIRLSLRKLFF